jgi:hypothetical protein
VDRLDNEAQQLGRLEPNVVVLCVVERRKACGRSLLASLVIRKWNLLANQQRNPASSPSSSGDPRPIAVCFLFFSLLQMECASEKGVPASVGRLQLHDSVNAKAPETD